MTRLPVLRFLLLLALVLAGFAGAARAQPAGEGALESAQVQRESRELLLRGWAGSHRKAVFTSQLVVRLDGREVYRGRMQRIDRPDIAQSRGRPDWHGSGFAARVSLPAGASGPAALSAQIVLTDGGRFDLFVPPERATLDLGPTPPRASPLAWALLLLAVAAPLAALRHNSARRFAWATALAFACLVAGGWTGSSLPRLFEGQSLVQRDGGALLGPTQAVRSDEWQVITPLAIAQANHEPAFPVVNRHFGTDGQNMLVIGMTGVPVAHVSSLARPATWGFHLFDLRRALAWTWWFPFFACFAACAALLTRVFALEWRLASALALAVSAAPYAVVFSGWPAYTVFFPALAWLALDGIRRSAGTVRAGAWGLVLGGATAGFVLVLYPAWQIALATLFLPVAAAWAWMQRHAWPRARAQAVALAVAIAVAALLLGAWWVDAREAVAAIRGTVYPGQRSLELGGDADGWYLLKGLISPATMYAHSPLLFGASDAGSVALFVVPLLALAAWRWRTQRRVDALGAVLVLYLLWCLAYLYLGLPAPLARLTLWGSTTWYRLDVAFAVAQMLLAAWWLAPRDSDAPTPRFALLLAGAVVLHAGWLAWHMPADVRDAVAPSYWPVALGALGVAAWALARRQAALFAAVALALALPASLVFNPLVHAAKRVAPADAWQQALARAAGPVADGRRGIAVVGLRNEAMALPAAGVAVVNSVFYTPPAAWWKRLDPQGRDLPLHNRYQRLLIEAVPQPADRSFRIESPRLDEVLLRVDPARFDFRTLGAAGVLAAGAQAEALRANPGLAVLQARDGATLFEVRP